jgi:uncharacterized protein YukJ
MPKKKYGVLKGTILGHVRDANDDHYQILVRAGRDMFRVAVNMKSATRKAPSVLKFQMIAQLPGEMIKKLGALGEGFTALRSARDGLALDYMRSGLMQPRKLKTVPSGAAKGAGLLEEELVDAVTDAMEEQGSFIYVFGRRWGPERGRGDQYFKFSPGNGIHEIHMNQGSSGKYRTHNGIYQDGAVMFSEPGGKWKAFFLTFASQSFKTDDRGQAIKPTQTRTRVKKST